MQRLLAQAITKPYVIHGECPNIKLRISTHKGKLHGTLWTPFPRLRDICCSCHAENEEFFNIAELTQCHLLMGCRPEHRGREMRLALLRDLEAEHGVRSDLASSGRRLREDDASRAAFCGNGSDISHFEACLLEPATDFRNGLADQSRAQVCFRRFPDRNQNVHGGAPYLGTFRWRILCHDLIGFSARASEFPPHRPA